MRPLSLITTAVALCAAAPESGFAQEGRKPLRLDDRVASATPRAHSLRMVGDGQLRFAVWVDDRSAATRSKSILVSTSLDRGITWSPESYAFDEFKRNPRSNDVEAAASNGVIFVAYDDDRSGVTLPTAVVRRSDDLGRTWTDTVLAPNSGNPLIAAEGTKVLALYYDNSAYPNILKARQSSNHGKNYGAEATVSRGDVDYDGWIGAIKGKTAYALWYDNTRYAFNNDLYISKSVGGGIWSPQVRIDKGGTGPGEIHTKPQIAFGNGKIYATWVEVDRHSNGRTEAYFAVSDDDGASWNETQISATGRSAKWLDLAAEGDTVAITWNEDRPGAAFTAHVLVSQDGGSSFLPEYSVPKAGFGENQQRQLRLYMEGGRIVLSFLSDVYTTGFLDEWPAYCFSVDDGQTWNGPFVLGTNFGAQEDVDLEQSSWHFEDGSLNAVWLTSDGFGDMIEAGGVRLPFVAATVNANQTVTFSMGGVPADYAGVGFARWAASVTTGSFPHPENSLEVLGLGASPVLNYMLARPRTFSARIDATGSASFTFPVGPRTGSLFVQGWLNTNASRTGGTTTSDVVEVTL
jgi:hypothetical protein